MRLDVDAELRYINKAPRTLASREVTVIILINAVIRMLPTTIAHEQLLLICINELYKSSPCLMRSCFMNVSLTHARVDGTALTRVELWMEWRDDKTGTHRAIALMHIAVACITTEELPCIISAPILERLLHEFVICGFPLKVLRLKKKERNFTLSDIFFEIRGIINVSSSNCKRTRPLVQLHIASMFCITIVAALSFSPFAASKRQRAIIRASRAHALSLPKGLRAPRPPGEFIEPAWMAANSCSHFAHFTQPPFRFFFLFPSQTLASIIYIEIYICIDNLSFCFWERGCRKGGRRRLERGTRTGGRALRKGGWADAIGCIKNKESLCRRVCRMWRGEQGQKCGI